MTSEVRYDEAYVWIWLPGAKDPLVAGRLSRDGKKILFNYGRSYLQHRDRIAIYHPELPLEPGILPLVPGLSMPSAIRDASPDAWGRRVIINRTLGKKADKIDGAELDELTYLLESGSDRIGALDFQLSATDYVPRQRHAASLSELMESAERVEKRLPLTPELDQALQHGTSLGGARPKVLIDAEGIKFIAKFSATNDLHNVVKAEYVAMRLAAIAGLAVAPVRLERAMGKDVFMVERFDRVQAQDAWHRRAIVSALTMLELDEMMARYASYEDLAEIIRHRFVDPTRTLRELFGRLVFNILCGNTDDHARNHAAFWDGQSLAMTPAYDICPQIRAGGEAGQAMLISGQVNASQLRHCLEASPAFLLSADEAKAIVRHQTAAIREHWDGVCDDAQLNAGERDLLWNGAFFKPYAFEGLPADMAEL
ncbi:HipA domain-containing protein [Sphingobium sp. 3R8]|uniref:type II toxin-antitoxin system HipA family toxin n=1 Tax=Sphingobium sp. 3R8 TaxID=2874921 RepID=UPI001CCC25C7|nr:HipA domain-containing protein [Sphingobium sp. 3R8]MBZ9647610.1 HipA domain-containing protein [Sphingobium sp. 3R8]